MRHTTQKKELRITILDNQNLYDLGRPSNEKKSNIYKGKIRIEQLGNYHLLIMVPT